jgi:streptogramin lyase
MSKSLKAAVLVATVSLFAGCAHEGTLPQSGPATAYNNSAATGSLSVQTASEFREYTLPANVNPTDLVRGPYNTVYFTGPTNSNPAILYQLSDSTGSVHAFTVPAPYEIWGGAITSGNDSVTFVVINHDVPEDGFDFASMTPQGHFTFSGAPYFEYIPPTNLTKDESGNLWFGFCADPCQGEYSGIVGSTQLGGYYVPAFVQPGPGGDIYATATAQPGGAPGSKVFVISPSGTILHSFALPVNSAPAGITTGSDHNLWIAEPGINKIARMTPTGTVTQFAIPTANAGPNRIVGSYDGALFFTETNAGKIGQITTAGKITEYDIPTKNSGPVGITPCSSTNCGSHGGVWFTEQTANKIGKFNAPN